MPALKRSRSKTDLKRTSSNQSLKRTRTLRQIQLAPSAIASYNGIAGGFPSRSKVVTLKFAREFTLNPGIGGASVEYVFRANSVYDPDYTGVGGQPYGHDQWASIYAAYCVIRSRIKVTASPSAQPVTCGRFGIYISKETSAAGTTIADVMEKNTSTGSYATIYSSPPAIARAACDVTKFFSLKDIMDDPNLSASVGGNPAQSPYYHVWMMGINGADADSCPFIVEMEFDVVYHDAAVLTVS